MVSQSKDEEEKSPLKQKLDEFGDSLTYVIGVICIIVWLMNYKNFFDDIHGSAFKGCIYYFKISVSLAVAAIPEGLPAVITTCLALGTKRMTENKAIMRKLDAIETLGCTTVICTDKTGTLTTNNMTVTKFMQFADKINPEISKVSGVSYNPQGEIENMKEFTKNIELLVDCSSMCNNSTILYDDKEESFKIHGSPTEAALNVFAEKSGNYNKLFKRNSKLSENPMEYNKFLFSKRYRVLFTIEFDRERKSKSVLCLDLETKKPVLFVKGATEYLVYSAQELLTKNGQTYRMSTSEKATIIDNINKYFTNESLRTLAISYKTDLPKELMEEKNYSNLEFLKNYFKNNDNIIRLEKEACLLGVVGIKDPPRPEVAQAIVTCHKAGIRVIMITGDNKLTAEAIGRECGVISESDNLNECSFTTADFFKLTDAKKRELLDNSPCMIFSRSEPKHKMELVKLLKNMVSIAL